MKWILSFAMACFSLSPVTAYAAQDNHVTVGVNISNNDGSLSRAFQDEEIQQLAENGVKTIRIGLVSYNMDFIIKAHQSGISSIVLVMPFLGARGWSDVVYSKTTPEAFTERVKPMLDKLEAAGVPLAAFELGNEINNSQFNGDLPAVGKGRELGLADLNNPNDPQASQVAMGFRAYVRLMAALKKLRDNSTLNQDTPIISAGLSQVHSTPFEVTLRDAIEFLNQNGMTTLADGYGIHVYPSGDPKRPVSARIASLDEDTFSACSASKPCWVTEWGFRFEGDKGQYCSGHDRVFTKVVQDLRTAFSHFASRGQLAALIYYDWTARPGAKDTFSVFRCGALTNAGKLALSPLSSSASQTASAQNNDTMNSRSSTALPVAPRPSLTQNVIVGVNSVGIDRVNEQQQDAFVEQLRQYGATTVRLGIEAKDAHFMSRAYQRGIGTMAIVTPWMGSEKIVQLRSRLRFR